MLWSVALVGLVGCSSQDARWHADKRFTPTERQAIEDGVAWLAGASGRDIQVAFDYDVTSEETLAHTIRRERGHYTDRYNTDLTADGLCKGKTVYLDLEQTPEADHPGLAAHELGHCELGFRDDYESQGIMHNLTPMLWTDREQSQL